MDETRAAANRWLLSRLLIGFGVFAFGSSIIGSLVLKALMVDVGAFAVIWLGVSVSSGSARVAKWSQIAMIYYVAVTAMMVVLGSLAPERVRIAGHTVSPAQLPYALAFLALAGLWALINLGFLRKYKHSFHSPMAENA